MPILTSLARLAIDPVRACDHYSICFPTRCPV
jgi:hypothetical protein